MFYITRKCGFHIRFENGYTVSVQFGPGHYCDNYNRKIGHDEEACGIEGSSTAECAVIDRNGELIQHDLFGDNTVSDRSSPAEVLELLNWAAKQ